MAVCDFLRVRHAFPDGTYHIDARGLDDALMLLYRIAAALQLPVPPDADERILRESLFTALASRSALLYIDRCDQLSGQELAPQFGELVSSLLARAPKVKLLLTCRKSLGVCNEQPLNLAVPELAMAEAKQMLQSMARMPSTHAATLAELCGCMPLALRLCGCALSGKRILLTPDQLIVRLEGETRRLQELHALSETSVCAFKHRPEWTGPEAFAIDLISIGVTWQMPKPRLAVLYYSAWHCPSSFPFATLSQGDPSVEACIASSYNALSPRLQFAFLALCELPGSFDEATAAAVLSDGLLMSEDEDEASVALLAYLQAEAAAAAELATGAPAVASCRVDSSSSADSVAATSTATSAAVPPTDDDAACSLVDSDACAEDGGANVEALGGAAPPSVTRRHHSGRLFELLTALVDDSMLELLPPQGPSTGVRSTAAATTAFGASAALPSSRRYRLHELIRLFGSGVLARAGRIGEAAQAKWRVALVRHWTRWLSTQSELWVSAENLAAIQAFDTERHNIEASLATARDVCPSYLPEFLTSGRMLLRQRLDPGSRRSLYSIALRVCLDALGGGDKDGGAAAAGDEVETAACVYIELGYSAGEQSQKMEGAADYARALLMMMGWEQGRALLKDAGVDVPQDAQQWEMVSAAKRRAAKEMKLVTGASDVEPSSDLALAVSDREQPAAYPAGEARDDDQNAALFDETERAHEKQLLMFLADSGVGPSPAAAESELAAEALNMLAINLDGQDRFRGSQILFIHAIRVRRKLLGPRHVDTAATYNNLANLLRKPAMNALGRNLLRDRSGSRVLSERHLNTHRFCEALYRRALDIREASFGANSPQLAATCSNLAVLLQHSEPKLPQHVDEAEKLLNRGLQIRRDVFGDEHSETAASYHLLGTLMFYHREELEVAERLYQRALQLRVKYYSRMSDRAGQTLFNLANLYKSKGEEVRAEELYVECLEIREKILGGHHVDSIKTAKKLASLYESLGRTEERKRLQRRIDDWKRRDGAAGDAAMLKAEARFPSIEPVPRAFNLRSRILGTKGYFMRHIMQQSGAERVSLRFATAETLTRATSSTAALGQPQSTQTAHGSEAAAAAAAATGGGGTEAASTAEDASDAMPLPADAPPPLIAQCSSTSSLAESSASSSSADSGQAYISVQATSSSALQKAMELCEAHLQKIAADYHRWSQKNASLQRSQSDGSWERPGGPSRGGSGTFTLGDFITTKPKNNKSRSGSGRGA